MQASKNYAAGDFVSSDQKTGNEKAVIFWKSSRPQNSGKHQVSGFTRRRRALAMQKKLQSLDAAETLSETSTCTGASVCALPSAQATGRPCRRSKAWADVEDDSDSGVEACERETSVGDTMSEVSVDRSQTWDGSVEGSRSRSNTWDFFEEDCNPEVGATADTAVPVVCATADAAVHQDGPSPTPNPAVCAWFTGAMPLLQVWPVQYSEAMQPQGTWVLVPCSPSAPTEALTASPCAVAPPPTQNTTLMLRHIPNNNNPEDVLAMLDSNGFAGQYDFFYLPRDFKSRAALGYAFVNFVSPDVALRAFQVFEKFDGWKGKSHKACEVQWSKNQGFVQNVAAVRNSPVMRKNVADKFKPFVFQNGVRIEFPERRC